MAKRNALSVSLEGPFFKRDPRKTVRGNIRTMMGALADETESYVRDQIQSHRGAMPHYTGHTARQVRGRNESLSGRDWDVSMVVSVDSSGMSAREATRTMAAASTIEERWHPFRRAAGAIRRSRAVLSANITKGL